MFGKGQNTGLVFRKTCIIQCSNIFGLTKCVPLHRLHNTIYNTCSPQVVLKSNDMNKVLHLESQTVLKNKYNSDVDIVVASLQSTAMLYIIDEWSQSVFMTVHLSSQYNYTHIHSNVHSEEKKRETETSNVLDICTFIKFTNTDSQY